MGRSSYNSEKGTKVVDFDTPNDKGKPSYNSNTVLHNVTNYITNEKNYITNEKTQFDAERRQIEQEINDLKIMYDEIIEGKNGEIDKLQDDIEKYISMGDTMTIQLKEKDKEKEAILLQKKEEV